MPWSRANLVQQSGISVWPTYLANCCETIRPQYAKKKDKCDNDLDIFFLAQNFSVKANTKNGNMSQRERARSGTTTFELFLSTD